MFCSPYFGDLLVFGSDVTATIHYFSSRLNSGGINLKPQEIRSSLYHSSFYSMLSRLNLRTRWRELLGIDEPDLHTKDVEFLLRSFALLIDGERYNPSMSKFLNGFSRRAKQYDEGLIKYCEDLFDSFLKACARLNNKTFRSTHNRFSITVFESVFCAVAEEPLRGHTLIAGEIEPNSVAKLRKESEFSQAVSRATTDSVNVEKRLKIARRIVKLVSPDAKEPR